MFESSFADFPSPRHARSSAVARCLRDPLRREAVECQRLSTGLQTMVLRRPGSPVVACRLFIAAGSRHDEGQGGRAHLTEHCLATSARLGGEPLELALEAAGAELEAGTHRDYLHFGVTSSSADLGLCLEALGAIVGAPACDAATVRHEQTIISHELAQYRDGLGPLWDVLFRALWQEHPWVPPPVGGSELFRLEASDVTRHRDLVLRPSRAVLAVVGDVDGDEVSDLARVWLGSWRDGAHRSLESCPPPVRRPTSAWHHLEAGLERSYFAIGWPVPPAGSPDDAALALLVRLLGEGASSVMSRELRTQLGLVYSVQATLYQSSDTGILAISGDCAPGRIEHVVSRVVELLRASSGPPLDARDVELGQRSHSASLARAYETASARAGLLGRTGLLDLDPSIGALVGRVASLTLADVLGCLERVVGDEPPGVALLGP
jgi:predicted Zn-dependent peptidase